MDHLWSVGVDGSVGRVVLVSGRYGVGSELVRGLENKEK
jgi:hypothetical protein